jgi:hypothetical protein
MNSKIETVLVPPSALQDQHLLAIYFDQNFYRSTDYAQNSDP